MEHTGHAVVTVRGRRRSIASTGPCSQELGAGRESQADDESGAGVWTYGVRNEQSHQHGVQLGTSGLGNPYQRTRLDHRRQRAEAGPTGAGVRGHSRFPTGPCSGIPGGCIPKAAGQSSLCLDAAPGQLECEGKAKRHHDCRPIGGGRSARSRRPVWLGESSVIFFCSCKEPAGCHRALVGKLLVKRARARRISLVVAEWLGGEPTTISVPVTDKTIRSMLNGGIACIWNAHPGHWQAG